MRNDPRQIAAALAARAGSIVTTTRGQQHGELAPSFNLIAEWFQTYLEHKITKDGVLRLDAVDILEFMSLVKKARNLYGDAVPDHTVDDIGYTALAGGLRLENKVGSKIMEEVDAEMARRSSVQAQSTNAVASALETEAPIPAFLKERRPAIDPDHSPSDYDPEKVI